MEYLYDRLRREATEAILATGLVTDDKITLAAPKPTIPADLAFPVFAAAQASGAGNPAAFAQKVAAEMHFADNGLIASATPAGGFVNFAVSPTVFAQAAIDEVLRLKNEFGRDLGVGAGKTVIVEYSSPNIAKKLHVGSMRTTVIGHSLYLIFQALGYRTIGDNHLGDWGTQFGYILSAIHDGNLTPWNDPDPVASLMDVYAQYSTQAKTDEDVKNNARLWFKKLEEGDTWARETWQKTIDLSLREFDKIYQRLDIQFDTQIGESFFEPVLGEVVQEALDKNVAHVEPGGAVVVDFGEESKLPSCLLRKTDGATLYQTRDAATCLYRWREYQPAQNIYVVGAEQKLHFEQVFEIARRLGYKELADASHHVAIGMVTKATGERFRTREGNLIFADEILDEAITRAKATVRAKIAEGKTELSAEEIETVGEMLGVGAVIYADLYQGPERSIAFDWDKMLSPDGNTAMYIQYTYARCRSILRKAGAETALPDADATLLLYLEEQAVVKQLSRLPHALREAGDKYLPATIADWTYNLAREFARFYHEQPVLDAPTPALRDARLVLVAATAQGLQNGLSLLGIRAPERV